MFESKAPLHRVAGLEQSAPADSPANPVPFRFFLRRFNGPDDVVCRSLELPPPVEILATVLGRTRVRRLLLQSVP